MRSIIIMPGFHEPWNWGEVVVMKNLANVLKNILRSEEILIYTLVDYNRLFPSMLSQILRADEVKRFYISKPVDLHKFSIRILASVLEKLRKENKNKNLSKTVIHIAGIKELWMTPISMLKLGKVVIHYFGMTDHYVIERSLLHSIKQFTAPIIHKTLGFYIATTSPKEYSLLKNVLMKISKKDFSIHLIPPPIDTNIYKPYPKHIALEKLSTFINTNITGDEFVIVYVGGLDENRFPLKVFQVIKNLIRKTNRKILFLMVVPPIRNKRPYVSKVSALINDLGLQNNVKLLPFNLHDEEKALLFSAASVFLYPSLRQAAMDPPLTILEAMSSGLPVVTTRIQSLPIIIKHFYNGFLYSPLNFTELEKILEYLIQCDNSLTNVSVNARNTIARHFSFEAVAKKLIKIYESTKYEN